MSDAAMVQRYFAAFDPRDHDVLGSCRHRDFEVIWPQSRERIPSHAADVEVHSHYPGYPAHEVRSVAGHEEVWRTATSLPGITLARPVQVSGGGDLWLGEGRLTYADGSVWFAVIVLEVSGGLVRRETTWYAPERSVPEWRRSIGEPLEWTGSGTVRETAASPSAARAREAALDDYVRLRQSDPAAAVAALFHPDAEAVQPQFSERLRGRDRILAAILGEDERPALEPHRIRVVGSIGLAEIRVLDGSDDWWVGVFEFEGDRASSVTAYRCPRLPAPEWRSRWVEVIES